MNFGHESESITWRHYGNVSLSRRAEIFEAFEVIEHVDGDMMRQTRELQQLKGRSDVGRAIELVGQFLQNLNGTSFRGEPFEFTPTKKAATRGP